jgi:hypothetical protein
MGIPTNEFAVMPRMKAHRLNSPLNDPRGPCLAKSSSDSHPSDNQFESSGVGCPVTWSPARANDRRRASPQESIAQTIRTAAVLIRTNLMLTDGKQRCYNIASCKTREARGWGALNLYICSLVSSFDS